MKIEEMCPNSDIAESQIVLNHNIIPIRFSRY